MYRKAYVPPGTGKTCLVRLTRKNGKLFQDCDVYIGPKLCNDHWVLEQSKWFNPFYSPHISTKKAFQLYSRHIDNTTKLHNSLSELKGKRLGCICRDLSTCHGRVLLEKIEQVEPELHNSAQPFLILGKHYFFKGEGSPLSNFFQHKFKHEDKTFLCLYQCFMWKKAVAGGERHMASRILSCDNCKDLIKLSKLLKHSPTCPSPWTTKEVIALMYELLIVKWKQVESFRQECIEHPESIFYESTRNSFWGCGLDMETLRLHMQSREKVDASLISDTLMGMNILGWLIKIVSLEQQSKPVHFDPPVIRSLSCHIQSGLKLAMQIVADGEPMHPSVNGFVLVHRKNKKQKRPAICI